MQTKILLADDHTMFREMLRNMFNFHTESSIEVVAGAGDAQTAIDLLRRHQPDLILLDYKIPGLGRLSSFCKEAALASPVTRILVLSGYAEEEIALEAALGGAHGYVLKGASIADLLSAVATVKAGGVWLDPHLPPKVFHTFTDQLNTGNNKMVGLSRRELQILSLIAQGMSNQEVGACLHIDKKTVKNHLTHIFQKLGVTSRSQASRYFLSKQQRP